MNPHNSCIALTPPGQPNRVWQCRFCGAEGQFDEMMGPAQSIECSYVYPPCTTCGQTPTCAQDCAAVLGALANTPPGVVVIGKPRGREKPS